MTIDPVLEEALNSAADVHCDTCKQLAIELVHAGMDGQTSFYAGISTLLATVSRLTYTLLSHPDAFNIDKEAVIREIQEMMHLTEQVVVEIIKPSKDNMQ